MRNGISKALTTLFVAGVLAIPFSAAAAQRPAPATQPTPERRPSARPDQTYEAPRSQSASGASSACARVPANDADVADGPSSRDLCTALQLAFTGADENLTQMTESSCGTATGAGGDPMSAMLCLMGSAAQAGGGSQLTVTAFRKIACEKAAGRPGYSCDYIVRATSANPLAQALLQAAPEEIANARFVRSAGRWMVIPNP